MSSLKAASFTDAFMRGYSFVDDIYARKRNEERLERRLSEERRHREFLRQQSTARGAREQQRLDLQIDARDRVVEAQEREEAAARAIAAGEDLLPYADTNIGFAELQRQNREQEAVDAAAQLNELGGLSAQATAAATEEPPVDPVTGESQLAGPATPPLGAGDTGVDTSHLPERYGADEAQRLHEEGLRDQVIGRLKEEAQIPELNVAPRGVPSDVAEAAVLTNRQKREQAEARLAVTEEYSAFLDEGQPSTLRDQALENPDVVTTDYFQKRSTLESVDPATRKAVDRKMQPVIVAYEQQIQEEVAAAPVGTPEHRRQLVRLRNVQSTAQEIYEDYKPAEAADINGKGMPVGNQELATQVLTEMDEADRPRPHTPQTSASLKAASTTVNRIKPNTRLNETQIRAVVRLKDAGLITSADASTILMTGQLPSTAAPVTFKEFDGDLYATDTNGNIKLVIPGSKSGAGRGNVKPNQITTGMMDDILVGLQSVMPGAPAEYRDAALDVIMSDQDFFAQRFDFRNQQSNIELGRVLGQHMFLADAENKRRDNEWNPMNWFSREDLTAKDLLKSPLLRDEIAANFQIHLQRVPEVRQTGVPAEFDVAGARQFLSTGDIGPRAQEIGKNGSDVDVYLELVRLSALTEEE